MLSVRRRFGIDLVSRRPSGELCRLVLAPYKYSDHHYLLLDALAEFPVVHEEAPPNGGRPEVPKGSEHLERAPFNLWQVHKERVARKALEEREMKHIVC